jgi:hypothetical protein
MIRLLRKFVLRNFIIAVVSISAFTYGQAAPSRPLESASSVKPVKPVQPAPSSISDAIQPLDEDPPVDPASLVPDLPPLPAAKATLIGGTVERLDRVQDELTIRAFGGGKVKTLFDPRTRVLRDGKPVSTEDLKVGDRIYADTILVDGNVFARTIRLSGANPEGEGQGVVLSYRHDSGELVVRDLLSPRPMKLRLNSSSRILRGNQRVSTNELVPGTLVSLQFQPHSGGPSIVRELSILITPGTEFTFTGRVTFLDLRNGLLVVTSLADHKTYEVHFNPSGMQLSPDLREGADVTVLTRYDGEQYVARGMTVEPNRSK